MQRYSKNGEYFDLLGIGVGPFNLSLAALLTPITDISALFLESKPFFGWHDSIILPDSKLQVSCLKDLVTLVDPTSPFSFLNFLSQQNRLYSFVNLNLPISLIEFREYMNWVSTMVNNILFNQRVQKIQFVKDKFIVSTNTKKFYAKDIVLGSGLSPKVPQFLKPQLCETLFHSSNFLQNIKNHSQGVVLIIGGGQSGAEIFYHLLKYHNFNKIIWVTRRSNFSPLDDSPFANEIFTPKYCQEFYNYNSVTKKRILNDQKLYSDGISFSLLKEIYERLYWLTHIEKKKNFYELYSYYNLDSLTPTTDKKGWLASITHSLIKKKVKFKADVVILSTGYQYSFPNYLDPIKEIIYFNGDKYKICPDYSIECFHLKENKIYVQNVGVSSHGIADPNLSLVSWRNALIINSICKRTVYPVEGCLSNIYPLKTEEKQYENIAI